MGQIHQLSAVLSNQIAAGEVVERPASVVKELVENAIDAHSRAVDIVIDSAGFKRIQVIDDGQGIAPDDVKTAFLRHATSKITDRRDLFKVASLGFRGEALPSIASVADVVLKTSTGGMGTEIHIRGGKLIDQKPAESRQGTNVVVSNLFYNTPARLKYMKTPATELSQITDIVDRLALGHPEIAISLVHNGRELLRTSGRNQLPQVIGSIYGAPKVQKMLPVHTSDLDFKVDGYVSLPELTRASNKYMSFIINGRFVRNHELNQSLVDGYDSKLMVGRYPMAVINIQTDPMLIDANVHPTKQTVRISKEDRISDLITNVVRKELGQQNLIPNAIERQGAVRPKYFNGSLDLNDLDQSDVSSNHSSDSVQLSSSSPNESPAFQSVAPQSNQASIPNVKIPSNVIIDTKTDLKTLPMQQFDRFYQNETPQLPFGNRVFTSAEQAPKETVQQKNTTRPFPNLVYIGQMHGTYLLAEADDGMYIVDQHAAQERINYERFRQSIGDVSKDQQNLLVPIILEYSNTDFIQISDHLDALKAIGIDLESFGKNSFIVHHHPSWFIKGQEEATIKEMVDWILKNGKISVADFRAKTAIMMSCKQAIKANHHLDRHQAEALLAKLATTEDPFNCPHGRPVLVHFSNYDMKKMFRRVQDTHQSLRRGSEE